MNRLIIRQLPRIIQHKFLTSTAKALIPFSSSTSTLRRRQNWKMVSKGLFGDEGSDVDAGVGWVTLYTTNSKAYFRSWGFSHVAKEACGSSRGLTNKSNHWQDINKRKWTIKTASTKFFVLNSFYISKCFQCLGLLTHCRHVYDRWYEASRPSA